MFVLELLDGLYTLYLIFIAGPRAVWGWIKRLRHPTPIELRLSATPEMQSFRRNAWLAAIAWLALSVVVAIDTQSFWGGAVVALLGVMLLPGTIEKRYDRLVERLAAMPRP